MDEEGWFKDSYQRHEARWISDGNPTAPVRDAGVESRDAPPDEPISVEMERIVGQAIPADGSDLKRADNAEAQELDPGALMDAAEEGIDSNR